MPPIKIALYQGKSDSGVEVNVALKERVMAQASAESADLIVFCETSLHGYCSGPVLLSEAEMQYGTTFQRISQLAAQLKIAVVYGYSERESEESSILYNSCIFIGKDGSCLGNYRKTHLWGDYEKSYFKAGDKLLDPFEFEGIKVSMLICFDIEFPETARYLTLKGAQLLVVPTALSGYDMTTITVPSRALENHIFIAYANCAGSFALAGTEKIVNFCGNSLVVGPDGHDIVRASKEPDQLVFATIDPSDPKWQHEVDLNPYIASRRTDLY